MDSSWRVALIEQHIEVENRHLMDEMAFNAGGNAVRMVLARERGNTTDGDRR